MIFSAPLTMADEKFFFFVFSPVWLLTYTYPHFFKKIFCERHNIEHYAIYSLFNKKGIAIIRKLEEIFYFSYFLN